MRVAVYGTLRKGEVNHYLLGEGKYLGTINTAPEYTMYNLGHYPCIKHEGNTSIEIEVYQISPRCMRGLDRLEGYPSYYNRELIPTEYGDAWIYFIRDVVDGIEIIEIGNWTRRDE